MVAKSLSLTPVVSPSANVVGSTLGAYCEVGARTTLLEVAMGDYSYVVNDSQIAYATIGKFCSIAAMTRINPGNHPMQRAAQAHFTYRASAYFEGEADDAEFFDWRRQHHVTYRPRRLDRPWRDRAAGPQHRHRRGGGGWRRRDQGCRPLHHRRRQPGAADPPPLRRNDRRAD